MLKPFRIRHLYGPEHGVVQITAPQYDSTIVSQPEAVLTYLDEDDGEVITVGSSFELGQRLDEPALPDYPRPATSPYDLDPLHIFDIKHTAASLATWREHAAYSSKTLRKNSGSSESTTIMVEPTSHRDLGMWTTDQNGRPVYDRYVKRDPGECNMSNETSTQCEPAQQLSMREDSPRSPVLDFSIASFVSTNSHNWEASPAATKSGKPVQLVGAITEGVHNSIASEEDYSNYVLSRNRPIFEPSSNNTSSTGVSKEEKPKPESSTTKPTTKEVNTISLDQIVTAALQGLDQHLGGFADFLQNTSKALRDAADKTRECDTSAVEGVLDGFRGILGEVGKIGRTMLETLDTEATTIVKDIAPFLIQKVEKKSEADRQSETDKVATETPTVSTSQTVESKQHSMPASISLHNDTASSTQAQPTATASEPSSNQYTVNPTFQVEQYLTPASTLDVPLNYRILNDCPAPPLATTLLKKVPRLPLSKTLEENHCTNGIPPCPIFETEVSASENRVSDTGDNKPLVADTDNKPLASDTGDNKPLTPSVTTSDLKPVPTQKDLSKFAPNMSKSILDLETSDPDFSVRFPPLMSLRRARTVAGLNNHALSSQKAALNTQTALSRYPSIDQLERNREKTPDAVAPLDKLRSWNFVDNMPKHPSSAVPEKDVKPETPETETLKATVKAGDIDIPKIAPLGDLFNHMSKKATIDEPARQQSEKQIKLDVVEPLCTSNQRLPGAWPENSNEYQTFDTPAWSESSGAFFDRMTCNRPASGPNPTLNKPTDVRRLSTLQPDGYRYGNPNRPLDMYQWPEQITGLQRSQTVTASNPAARLTRPFDPMMPSITGPPDTVTRVHTPTSRPSMPLFPREPVEFPRRSGTERQHRRRPHWTARSAAVIGQPFDPFAPDQLSQAPPQTQPAVPTLGPRPMRSVPNFSVNNGGGNPSVSPWRDSRNSATVARATVDECVMQLKSMGYGASNPHEASRLNVYACAASGNVLEALEMIEEDRKGSWEALLRKNEEDRNGRRSLDV
jgi:hypothetical protein